MTKRVAVQFNDLRIQQPSHHVLLGNSRLEFTVEVAVIIVTIVIVIVVTVVIVVLVVIVVIVVIVVYE